MDWRYRPRKADADIIFPNLEVIVDDFLPERCQCQSHQPEVHLAPRETDDGDAKQQTKAKMGQGDPEATDEEPKNVHEHVKASAVLRLVNNVRAERPQRENAQPHGGNTERYADDGDHQQQRGYEILYRNAKSTEDEPNDVSQYFHA